MPSDSAAKAWDFSQVLALVNTLSTSPPVERRSGPFERREGGPTASRTISRPECRSPASLGDFSKLWEYLGTADNIPPPDVPLSRTPPDQPAYTSDGAAYQPPSTTKGIRWRDEVVDGDDSTDTTRESESKPKPLTKAERRKLQKQQRQRRREAQQRSQKTASDFDSDIEKKRAPAKKASQHNVTTISDASRPPRIKSGEFAIKHSPAKPSHATSIVNSKRQSKSSAKVNGATPQAAAKRPESALAQSETWKWKDQSTPQRSELAPSMSKSEKREASRNLTAALQQSYQQRLPEHVSHISSPYFNQLLQQPGWLQPGFLGGQAGFLPTPTKRRSKPLVIREGAERNLALRLRLIHDFGADKKWLTSPVPLANHTDPRNGGIHVFIDFSNIWIGFMELIKRLQGLHPQQRTPHTNISFDSLVLLLERGRPVAKRVLAGSSPLLPAFDTARAIGYELNILDKVFKAKELSEKQRRFQAKAVTNGNGAGDVSGGSGSETAVAVAAIPPSHTAQKWVEQGVDEILHLKMLESVVDASEKEVSTMVLATGDAAQAEYSAGFLRMVERALRKGWRVELVSWSKAISFEYRKTEWESTWSDGFKILELDSYAEFLLDT